MKNSALIFTALILLSGILAKDSFAQAAPNEIGSAKQVTESKEYESLKQVYKKCVLDKAKRYLKVAGLVHVIEHAPIACKREFFSIRQFLLSGAFKVSVIDELMESIETGVQIDLVNTAYDEAIRLRSSR